MLFRFTLDNTIEGSHVITDPDGWNEIKLKLERHKEFHSLVEVVELPLIFYKTSDLVDGGYDYIRNVEQTQGVDAIVEILIEVSTNQGDTYETFFEGLLELETIKDISDASFYKMECNIIRNDFWSKFINRRDSKVDLNATTSLDGDSLTVIDNITMELFCQVLPKTTLYQGNGSDTMQFLTGTTLNAYSQVGLNLLQGEILDSFTIPFNLDTVDSNVVNVIEVKETGSVLDVSTASGGMRFIASVSAGAITSVTANLYCKKNSEASKLVATATTAIGAASCNTLVSLTGTNGFTDIVPGDLIYVWANWSIAVTTSPATTNTTLSFEGMNVTVQQQVTFVDTMCEAFVLSSALKSILTKIISRNNVLYSDYLGVNTPSLCASTFAITKGLHIRGYTMAEKPMSMSFDDWWSGGNPIFNFGLGYETIAGTEYIRVEEKEHFYNDTPIMTLSNVEKITRTYDKDRIFKSIEIGYEKWSAESNSGVDDPQTKHTYNTRFKVIGKDEKILSKFIAASLAIEQTRRNRVELGKDWRLDEDVMIIAMEDGSTPFRAESDADFSSVTGLLNSATRYNIRLTPARNFERWKPYFNGCLQTYIPETYNFASGEGNCDMSSTGAGSCDNGALTENQDINVTTDYYSTTEMYEFEVDFSFEDYKTLRDNRKNCIEVSETSTGHKKFFIDNSEYDHFNGRCKFSGWIKD